MRVIARRDVENPRLPGEADDAYREKHLEGNSWTLEEINAISRTINGLISAANQRKQEVDKKVEKIKNIL